MTPFYRFHNPKAIIPKWECHEGDRFTLTAPTGWGKTQWLRQLTLLRDGDESTVQWQGANVTPSMVNRFRAEWMYLPQQANRSSETIEEHLRNILKFQVHSSRKPEPFLEECQLILNKLGLGLLVGKRVLKELSGGELQIVALVRGVLLGPKALLLDEPTSALDFDLCLKVEDWLFQRFLGAMIWVSHDQPQRERLRTRGLKELNTQPSR